MIVRKGIVPRWITDRVTSNHLAAFGTAWVLVFFLLPVGLLLLESINTGEGSLFQAYEQALQGIYTDTYLRTFYFSLLTTVLTLTLSYILSYYLAFIAKKTQLLLVFVLLPFWVAYIVRYFGLLISFSPTSPIVQYTGVDILFTKIAVIVGMTNIFIPFAVLPIYNSLSSINRELVDASRVLGASQWRTIYSVIFPQSLPGVIAAGLIVFILAAGSFLAPDVLGGTGQPMIANLITSSFLETFNVQLAAAISVIYTVLLLLILAIVSRIFNLQEVLSNL